MNLWWWQLGWISFNLLFIEIIEVHVDRNNRGACSKLTPPPSSNLPAHFTFLLTRDLLEQHFPCTRSARPYKGAHAQGETWQV